MVVVCSTGRVSAGGCAGGVFFGLLIAVLCGGVIGVVIDADVLTCKATDTVCHYSFYHRT